MVASRLAEEVCQSASVTRVTSPSVRPACAPVPVAPAPGNAAESSADPEFREGLVCQRAGSEPIDEPLARCWGDDRERRRKHVRLLVPGTLRTKRLRAFLSSAARSRLISLARTCNDARREDFRASGARRDLTAAVTASGAGRVSVPAGGLGAQGVRAN